MTLRTFHPKWRWVSWILATLMALGPAMPPAGASDLVARVRAKWHSHKGIASAEALAGEIDALEKHVDWYGSIVAKQPDVWGQARLMKYRQEFEEILAAQKDGFTETLQASISRTDQAFLAQALSLSAAVSGAPATLMPPTRTTTREVVARRKAALKASGVADPTPEQLGAGEDLPALPPPGANPSGELVSDAGVIARREVASGTGVGFGQASTLSLEPTVRLDQLKRYVDHLHEIRRVNEGDDTADSPGYGLHLVRVPVSILPGTHTRRGYGAEITITATPYLGRDLLPTTFRNLVVNDLVEQITTPLVEFFNSPTSRAAFLALRASRKNGVEAAASQAQAVPILGAAVGTPPGPIPLQTADRRGRRSAPPGGPMTTRTPAEGRPTPATATGPAPPTVPPARGGSSTAPPNGIRRDPALRRSSQAAPPGAPTPAARPIVEAPRDPGDLAEEVYNKAFLRSMSAYTAQAARSGLDAPTAGAYSDAQIETMLPEAASKAASEWMAQAAQSMNGRVVPGSRGRNARYAFPATQMGEVYGPELILSVAFEAFDVHLRKPIDNGDDPSLLPYHRASAYVQDQASAAYDFLARPENLGLWSGFATPELARAVQGRDAATLETMRSAFLASLPGGGVQADQEFGPRYSTLAAMAWAIMVESVMLNERLIRDIRETATAKGGAHLLDGDLPFFLPCPPDEARDAFNAYVKTRFPIHVFALDPVNQEQNLADQLSRAREMQFALSLAFVTGKIGAGSMTKFARRLELQSDTIALNRTQVGFSHGEHTFGWRFQPRYQTPPTPNHLDALRETVLGGPTRDGDRRQLELEPGQRECVALVIMPSFVPYVTFETRANWFRLNSPKHSEIDPVRFLALSASIKRAFILAERICDAGLYRDGDIALLVNRVKQLSAELPMQSMIAQVPYENTSGGFELFNVGVTDLAPELRSWYGAPGVGLESCSSLFLVGDNFSVNQTDVVVGNRRLSPRDVTLLSRQVMRVSVPPGAQTVMRNGLASVEASIATPYGVSQSLAIPVVDIRPARPEPPAPPPPPPSPTFTWATPTLVLAYKLGNLGIVPGVPGEGPPRRPANGLIIGLDGGVDLADTLADLTLTFEGPDAPVPRITLADIPFKHDAGGFVLEGPHFDRLVSALFDDQRFGLRFGDQSPPRDVVSRTTLRLKGHPQALPGGKPVLAPVIPADVANRLTIKWQKAP